MDLKKLTTGDWVVGVSGVVLLIASFLPWYEYELLGFGSESRNGWEWFLWGILPTLIGIALVALVVIQRFTDVKLPDVGSVSWGQIALIAAAIAAVLVLLKLLIGESTAGFDADRQFGIYVATLAALGLVVGGFLRMQEERAGATGGTTPPPPPAG